MKIKSEDRIMWPSDGNTALDPVYEQEERGLYQRPDSFSDRQRRKERLLCIVGICRTDLNDEEETEPEDPESDDRILRLVGLTVSQAENTVGLNPEMRCCGLTDSDACEETDRPVPVEKAELSDLAAAGVMGLLEQICLFSLLGLQVSMTPVVTLVFLWFLFSMITAGIMAEIDEWIRGRGKRYYERMHGRIYCGRKNREKIRRGCV